MLTNAMQPMQRAKTKASALHEDERGPQSWVKAIAGLGWLNANGFRLALAGRARWQEGETTPG